MADEREGQSGDVRREAERGKVQTAGRDDNAAQPLNAAKDNAGPERYPSVRQDDAVERTGRTEQVTGERRSFDPSADAPTPPDADGEGSTAAKQNGFGGPQGDPAEGKR